MNENDIIINTQQSFSKNFNEVNNRNADSNSNYFCSNKNNFILKNEFHKTYFVDNNIIYKYYFSTIENLKKFKDVYNCKNFKIKSKKDYEKKIDDIRAEPYTNNSNFSIVNNLYTDNYSFNRNKLPKEDLHRNFQMLDRSIININISISNKFLYTKNSSYLINKETKCQFEKDEQKQESLSTSTCISPTSSEKSEKPVVDFSLDNSEITKNEQNQSEEENEYLLEMFGRKGWICILCNNFNYETRKKCNRFGEKKKKKKIINKNTKDENHLFNFKKNIVRRDNWICSKCKNVNYSFRTYCNRCKLPKIYSFVNNTFTYNQNNIYNLGEINYFDNNTQIFA